jgi:hypothetical protein
MLSPKLLQYFNITFLICRGVKKDFKLSDNKVKGKVVPVLNELSTTPRRRMGEWMYRSKVS